MNRNNDNTNHSPFKANVSEVELSDDDILAAMQHIPGYLDITTEDFRSIYHLAYHHAVNRIVGGINAGHLMRKVAEPLRPDMTLDIAAQILAQSGFKSLPVVDSNDRVIGILTETDFLRRLKASNFLELLLRLLEDSFEFTHRCHETRVSEAMVSVITIGVDSGFAEIMKAFGRHEGRSMPVVDHGGKLCGLLYRKDFLHQVGRILL
jgi:CBS domain-containing membrane protein